MVEETQLNSGVTPTWCPGCGDFGIWAALKKALLELGTPQNQILLVYGIGCHGHMVNFLSVNGFEGLHGRPVPVAVGAKLANHSLEVIIVTGDGDCYGEGAGHLIAAARANHDIACLVHNNEVYGLTTGQTAPTAVKGFKTKSTPAGVIEIPVNPLFLAMSAGATFVARGFAGDIEGLKELILASIRHKGFALLDVLQPCVTFDRVHTYPWYRERIYKLDDTSHDRTNLEKAVAKTIEWPALPNGSTAQEEKIPIGIFYQVEKPTYEEQLPQLASTPLVGQDISRIDITPFLKRFS